MEIFSGIVSVWEIGLTRWLTSIAMLSSDDHATLVKKIRFSLVKPKESLSLLLWFIDGSCIDESNKLCEWKDQTNQDQKMRVLAFMVIS